MDRISESLLTEFSQEHDLMSLPDDARFEHFAAHVTVWRSYSETFDTEEVVTGAGGDTGLDAIAVLVNGFLVTDVDTLRDQFEDAPYLEVVFIFEVLGLLRSNNRYVRFWSTRFF